MIRIIRIGRNFTMRYLTRTRRLPIAWMHERFKAKYIVIKYEVSARMAVDICTKAFVDADKWVTACSCFHFQFVQAYVDFVKLAVANLFLCLSCVLHAMLERPIS